MGKWSLVLLKPELVAHPVILRRAVGDILAKGIRVNGAQKTQICREKAEQLYGQHKEKFFYGRLVRHICSGPVIALQVQGDVRSILGSSKLWPLGEKPTLRQQFALSDVRNVAHNSDADTADSELQLFGPFSGLAHILCEILKEEERETQDFLFQMEENALLDPK